MNSMTTSDSMTSDSKSSRNNKPTRKVKKVRKKLVLTLAVIATMIGFNLSNVAYADMDITNTSELNTFLTKKTGTGTIKNSFYVTGDIGTVIYNGLTLEGGGYTLTYSSGGELRLSDGAYTFNIQNINMEGFAREPIRVSESGRRINFSGTNTFTNNKTSGSHRLDLYNNGEIYIIGGTTTLNGGINTGVNSALTQINSGATLVLGGSSAIVIQNSLHNNGTLALDASVYSNTSDNFRVTNFVNAGTVRFTGGTLSRAISGNVQIGGNVTSNVTLSNSTTVNSGGTLNIIAGYIGNAITNNGTLNINGGILSKAINGSGTTNIKGDVTANAKISNSISVYDGKQLTASADYIGGAVSNGYVVKLTGGTLSKAINGGVLKIAGNVSSSADYIKAVATNIISDNLRLTGGTLANSITSENGTLTIDGNVTSTADIYTDITVNENKQLTIGAGNIKQDVTNNSGAIVLTDGELAKTIGGTVEIKSGATVGASNDKFTGTLTNSGTYNISGDLNKDIAGSGTTVLQNDSTVTDGITIDGTLDTNGKTIAMRDNSATYQTLNVGSLKGNGNLSIDVDITNNGGKATANDKINITSGTNNGGTLNLSSINVIGKSAGYPDTNINNFIDYVTGTNSNINYKLMGSSTYAYDEIIGAKGETSGRLFRFTLGNSGSLNMEVKNGDMTLSEFVTSANDWGAYVNTYSINSDYNQTGVIGETAQRKDPTTSETSNVLNICLNNGADLYSVDSSNGITVANGITLNVTGSEGSEIQNFGTAFTNNGTLNLKNVTMNGNANDVINNSTGALNLSGTNNIASITNDGTLSLEGTNTIGTLLGSGTATNTGVLNITAEELCNALENNATLNLGAGTFYKPISGTGTTSIKGNVIAEASINNLIDVTSGNTLTADANDIGGNITNNGGTVSLTNGELTKTITGDGSTSINGDITANALISNAINVASGTLRTNADYIGNAVTNDGGIVSLTGGTLTKTITGDGTTKIDDNVTSEALISNLIEVSSGRKLTIDAQYIGNTVTSNGGTVDLTGGTLTNAISGSGSTSISGDVISDASIANSITINNGKTLSIGASNIGGTVNNGGILNIGTGTLDNGITGSGSIVIDGDVVSNVEIASKVSVNDSKKLTIGAGNIKNAVTNNGDNATVELNAGTLEKTITGGKISIAGDVSTSADYLKGDITNSASQLTLTGGELAKSITGSGTTKIDTNKTVKVAKGVSFGDNTLSFDSSTLDLTNNAIENTIINKLSGTANFNLEFDGTNIDSLTLNAIDSTPTVAVTAINIIADGEASNLTWLGGSGVTADLTDNTGLFQSATADYIYTFKGATEGASKGQFNVTREKLADVTLSDIIQNYPVITSYSLKNNLTLNTDLGALGGTNRNFTIFGNGNKLDGNTTNKGIETTLGKTQTFTLDNTSMVAFKDYAIKNNSGGTVNLTGTNTFSGNSPIDIINDGSLNVYGSTTMEKGINGTGTTNIGSTEKSGALVLGENADLIQNALNIATKGSLTANASKLNINSGSGNIANDGEIKLTGGTLDKTTITGGGTTIIDGIVEFAKSVANKITVNENKKLTSNADYIGGVVTNKGTVDLNGGTLEQYINGGVINIIADTAVTLADYLNGDTVNNSSNLTLNGGNINKAITGTGTTIIGGDVTANALISTLIKVTSGNKLTTDAQYIGNTVTNAGTVSLIGGTLNKEISGAGTTSIDGNVLANAKISSAISITSPYTLTSNGDYIKGNVTNAGNLNLTGGTLEGITVNNSGNINLADGKIKDISLDNTGNLNLAGGTLDTVTFSGTGNINLIENAIIKLTNIAEIPASQTFTANNNSTIDLQDGRAFTTAINGLKIASGHTVKVAMDWGDQLNSSSSNINGNLKLQTLDLTNYDDTSKTFTNISPNFVIADDIQMLNMPTGKNSLKITGTTMDVVTINSVQDAMGMDGGTANQLSYTMSGNEFDNSTMTLADSKRLVIAGDNNTLTSQNIEIDSNSSLSLQNLNVAKTSETAEIKFVGTSAELNIVNNSNEIITVDNKIVATNKDNKVNFSGTEDIHFNGYFDPLVATVGMTDAELVRGNYDDDIQWNLNGGTLRYTNDKYLYDSSLHGSTYALNQINFNGGGLDMRNGVASDIKLSSIALTTNTNSNMYVDADLASSKMDTLNSTSVSGSGKLHIAGINLLSEATSDVTTINFTSTSGLMENVDYTGGNPIAYSPISKYIVNYDSSTGNFGFTRNGFNPSVLASSVGAQVGAYLTQITTYEQAFGNMDMMMNMTQAERQAMKFANKYASADTQSFVYSPNQIPEQDKGLWFRPYATFEKVGLNNGPNVENTAYGSLFGGDSEIIELSHGWDMVWGLYAGYTGSHQSYDGVGIYQNGGTLGVNASWYKGNFFTGLTANVGASNAQASTMYGHEDYTMLMAGIASKTGYNWELCNSKLIIQPSFLMSYSFVNTFDYTNASGVDITSDPLHAIQIVPGLKIIGNLKNGWQPYALVQMVWNILDKTNVSANDISLPQMSIDPYVQYGIGVQKRWGDRFTGYGQVMIRNGGRTGVVLNAGFRWALGKEPSNKGKLKQSNNKLELKKADIKLSSMK